MTPSPSQTETARWVIEGFADGVRSVLEAMAGTRPDTSWEMLPAPPPIPDSDVFRWVQALTTLDGEMYLWTGHADVLAIGNRVMLAAGVEDSQPEELQSTFLEIVGQAFSMVARHAQARMGREITPSNGQAASGPPGDCVWGTIRILADETASTLYLGLPPVLLEGLMVESKPAARVAAASAGSEAMTAPEPVPSSSADDSKTFDLLLDVELPVSVSFGHAQVPLKDVLKLTTGSIVELSRAIVEPVDIVVNNCVIARGEVVVVEGNFGVRIQQVVSRRDRLRTLQ